MTTESARQKFDGLRDSGPSDADLDAFWTSLAPLTIKELLGEWKGGEFHTGHKANGMLAKGNWFGKTFVSANDVKPLVCIGEDGDKFSNTKWMNGEGSLWLEEFRGEVTATLVYDGVPLHDHFKRIDDRTVMGIMNGKNALDEGRYLYFYLERV